MKTLKIGRMMKMEKDLKNALSIVVERLKNDHDLDSYDRIKKYLSGKNLFWDNN